MNQQELKRQIVRQAMRKRASTDPFGRQIRTAGMLYEAGMKDDLKGLYLKYVANPLSKSSKHLRIFKMPFDDLLDDIVEALAPKLAETMLEQEVDADFEEFEAGASLRYHERSMSRGGYIPEMDPPKGKSPEYYEGYLWGNTNKPPVPASVKKRLIEEAAVEHDSKVIERALKRLVKGMNPIEIAKHGFHFLKEKGWNVDEDMVWYKKWGTRFYKMVIASIAWATGEYLEHYVVPKLVVELTGNDAWWSLAAFPFMEIILPIVLKFFKKEEVEAPGHLDWYEENYGEIENVLEPNVFTDDEDDEDTTRRTASRYRYYGAY